MPKILSKIVKKQKVICRKDSYDTFLRLSFNSVSFQELTHNMGVIRGFRSEKVNRWGTRRPVKGEMIRINPLKLIQLVSGSCLGGRREDGEAMVVTRFTTAGSNASLEWHLPKRVFTR